jgi:hypothetical protein
LALTLVGVVWTALLILGRRSGVKRSQARTETYANSALLSVLAGSTLAVFPVPSFQIHGLTIVTLGLSTGVLLALSLNLYFRWLFYLFLAWGGATAAALKLTYFPGPSLGLTEILAAAVLWGFLWWLDRQPDELSAIARRRAWEAAPVRLLWFLPGACAELETLLPELDKAAVPVSKACALGKEAGVPGEKAAAMDVACV